MGKPLTDRIEHVVVLMLENRSFDNVLGGLYPKLTSQGLYRGLLGTETNPLNPSQPRLGSVTVFQGPPASSVWIMPYPDPGELYSDMVQQIFGSNSSVLGSGMTPPMSGFAWNYSGQPWSISGPGWPAVPPVPRNIMQYYSGLSMQVTSKLANNFAVCDSWFASGPVQTLANRTFVHCGTPSKLTGSNQSRVNNPDFTAGLKPYPPLNPPVTDPTIFELFDNTYPNDRAPECSDFRDPKKHLNWKVYYHDAPLSALCDYVYEHWCWDYLFGGNVYDFYEYTSSETNFEYDIRNGLLPKYSFIEPRYSNFWSSAEIVNSNHPGGAGIDFEDFNGASLPPPINVQDGEALLNQIYSILVKYPDVFAKTLLIVTYDEHGGLFDHVAPYSAVSPFVPPVTNFGYNRYGARVPALFISPWIKPQTVYPARKAFAPVPNPPFDHTSILSTLIAQFGLNGSLTPRVTQAPMLEGLISDQWNEPPAPEPLPLPSPPVRAGGRPLATIPDRAPNLAGALGALYGVMQTSTKRPRP